MRPKRPFVAVGRSLAVSAIALALAAPVPAHPAANGEVALSSQLVDRGIAVTRPGPALQGAMSWVWPSGWSLGLAGGIELRHPDHLAEELIQVSHYWPASADWRMQGRVLYYHYSEVTRRGFYEAGLDWIYRDILTVGVSGIYTADRDHRLRPAADLDFRWPLQRDFSLAAGAGVSSYARPPYGQYEHGSVSYYRYGHLGVLWNRGPWQFKLDRLLVRPQDRDRMHRSAPSPWLATLSRSF